MTSLLIFLRLVANSWNSDWGDKGEQDFRSSHPEVSYEIRVLKNFAKFTGKHLCQSLLFNEIAGVSLQLY